ncbi:CDP-glycerol glycerophosphotransferase family protein [Alteromonas sp. CYL-A6]|uniref:CDP-glycerol glycerophosphotransferase family protein n=1 Tax=Alteromonas nitratireducens TaxID=3390813 RepID=UPI0034A9C814
MTWQNKRVYVAPDNPAGRALSQTLTEKGAQVLGRVDNLKHGPGVINRPETAEEYDAVVVAPGEYQLAIAEGLIARGFNKNTVLLATRSDAVSVSAVPPLSLWKRLSRTWRKWVSKVLDCLPASGIVYYAEGAADTNILVAFDFHVRHNHRVSLVVKNAVDKQHPAQHSHPLICRWLLQRAKVLVVDHEFSDPVFNHLRTKKAVIQLWHGLPFKYLAGNRHFAHVMDHTFVSSSAWFNDNVFPSMFKAQHYKALGYPRNDALLQTRSERCWLNCVDEGVMDSFVRGRKLLVYMPTYRDDGNNDYPIDWRALDNTLAAINAVCLVKTHPFLCGDNVLKAMPGCERIAVYPGRMNIYPWLAEADLLITDYSSVALDFLLCDKPIIHYCYDYEHYAAVRGQYVIEQTAFMAGPMVRDANSLIEVITSELTGDSGAQQRKALRQRYQMVAEPACPALVRYLDSLC